MPFAEVPDFDFGTTQLMANLSIFVINMQACASDNLALLETFNDPGNQLDELEQKLILTRAGLGRMIILGAGKSPGAATCNRQWSHRFNALIDEY